MLEKDVIAGLHDEDPAAWRKLWDDYSNTLTYFGIRLIKDPDAVQRHLVDTYVKFWRIRKNFTTLVQIRAFLFVTLRNSIYDELRQKKTKKAIFSNYVTLANIHEQVPAEEKPDMEDLQKLLHTLLNELPETNRRILQLSFMEGLSTNEIAKKLGITVSTVSTLKSRALNTLRSMVDNGQIPGLDPSTILAIMILIELMAIN